MKISYKQLIGAFAAGVLISSLSSNANAQPDKVLEACYQKKIKESESGMINKLSPKTPQGLARAVLNSEIAKATPINGGSKYEVTEFPIFGGKPFNFEGTIIKPLTVSYKDIAPKGPSDGDSTEISLLRGASGETTKMIWKDYFKKNGGVISGGQPQGSFFYLYNNPKNIFRHQKNWAKHHNLDRALMTAALVTENQYAQCGREARIRKGRK